MITLMYYYCNNNFDLDVILNAITYNQNTITKNPQINKIKNIIENLYKKINKTKITFQNFRKISEISSKYKIQFDYEKCSFLKFECKINNIKFMIFKSFYLKNINFEIRIHDYKDISKLNYIARTRYRKKLLNETFINYEKQYFNKIIKRLNILQYELLI